MIVVIIIVVAVLLVAGAVALVATRRRAHPSVAGEPPAPVAEKPAVDAAAETVPTPTVEELEALLEAPAAPEPVIEAAEPEVLEKPRLRDRLGRTRSAFTGAFSRMRGRKIDDETWDELEEALLLADVGLPTTGKLLDAVRTRAKETSATEPDELISLVRDEIVALLDEGAAIDRTLHAPLGEPNVWMFVGVNGVGKTTTIGKLASQQVSDGHRVVLAAADTFRAAAADQLQLWAERTGGEIIRGQ